MPVFDPDVGWLQNLFEGKSHNEVQSFYTGVAKLAGAEQRVMDRLADAAMDPQYAAGLLSAASAPNRMGLLGRQIEPALPALSGAGLLSYQAR